MYSVVLNTPNEPSKVVRSYFGSPALAEEWCRGFMEGMRFAGIPFPEVYTWQIWDDDGPAYQFVESKEDSLY